MNAEIQNKPTEIIKKVIKGIMWCGDPIKDKFMHNADMFGDYEMLIDSLDNPFPFDMTIDGEWTVETKSKHILKFMRSKVLVPAMIIPNYPELNWRDRSIWKVSDGHHFMMLTELLKYCGWENPILPFKIGSKEFKKERIEAKQLLNK